MFFKKIIKINHSILDKMLEKLVQWRIYVYYVNVYVEGMTSKLKRL